MNAPTDGELADALTQAARAAIGQLFAENPEHRFYYVSLVTTGQGHPPLLTAWSEEALAEAVRKESHDARMDLKWSYADSPFCCFGEQHFDEVRRLFAARQPSADPVGEVHARLRAMETAMRRLDREGLFGKGEQRQKIVVSAEIMPPDATNTDGCRSWFAS